MDADSYVVSQFTGADLEQLAPETARHELDAIDAAWPHESQRDLARDDFLRDPLEDRRLTPALHAALVQRLAPLHIDGELSTPGTVERSQTVDPPGMRVADLVELPA